MPPARTHTPSSRNRRRARGCAGWLAPNPDAPDGVSELPQQQYGRGRIQPATAPAPPAASTLSLGRRTGSRAQCGSAPCRTPGAPLPTSPALYSGKRDGTPTRVALTGRLRPGWADTGPSMAKGCGNDRGTLARITGPLPWTDTGLERVTTCPRSHSMSMVQLGLGPRPPVEPSRDPNLLVSRAPSNWPLGLWGRARDEGS